MGRGAADGRARRPARARWVAGHRGRRSRTKSRVPRSPVRPRLRGPRHRTAGLATAHPVRAPDAGSDAGASAQPGRALQSDRLRAPSPGECDAALLAALDTRLERLRAKYGIPGISASILFADGSAWHGAAGLADVVAKRKVTDETAFPVASVSKTFTSALILRLAEDGLLDLDASVRSYLPTLGISRAVTVRELLDHTSGLRDFFFHPRIDHDLLTKPTLVWDAARSLNTSASHTASPARRGTTRTPTT